MTDQSRYYEEELAYLLEAGREYAKAHPDRARHLNLQDSRARDPHVERLVEAFAFLAGNVRQRLDDDFPELTQALLDLVWPHVLRPVPSLALLQMRPIPGMLREAQVVAPGLLVDSAPTSAGVACRFRTCYPVELYPLELEDAGVVTDDAGQRFVRLRLRLLEGADAGAFSLDRLRIHLAGEPSLAFASYTLLGSALESVTVRFARDRARVLPPRCLRPVGFGPGDEVLPYTPTSFPGYRLLSEYFAFPEKFLFVDLLGVGSLDLPKGERCFDLEMRFRSRPPDLYRPTRDDFRLFTTPIVNLFPRQGEPITVSHERQAYRVLGDYTHPDAVEVVAVRSVEGLGRRSGARRSFAPFFSFEHEASERDPTYYHVRHRIGPEGGWQSFLSLISPVTGRLPEEHTLSLEIECTNGRLCREVGIDTIRVTAGSALEFASFGNITRPTDPIYPRLGRASEWDFVSHMALNVLSLTDAAALRRVLSLYEPTGKADNQRRIEAIRGVSATPGERLVRGTPVRGTRLEVSLADANFAGEGDVRLFRDVLAEFLSLYATINSWVQLTVVLSPSGEVLTCPAADGRQSLI